MLLTNSNYSHTFQEIFLRSLPVRAYVLVGICPMAFCPDIE